MLDSLRIKNFRCFEDLQIESLGRVNLIVGKNNVGKTTLLESIDLLTSEGDIEIMLAMLKRRGYSLGETQNLDDINDVDLVKPLLRNPSNPILKIGTLSDCRFVEIDLYGDWNIEPSPMKFHPHAFVPSYLQRGKELSDLWDQVYLNSDDSYIYDFLGILINDITSLAFVGDQERVCYTKTKSRGAMPLKSEGEGMGRLLQISLQLLMTKGGYLMIDEFENGLHYSIQEEVWKKLFKLAEELDIQVFATTHSQDTIKSFCKVAVENRGIEGKLISLGRSVKTSNKDQIMAVEFDETQLKRFIDSGMEVRG